MVALADVRRWDPDAVERAFLGLRAARDQLTDLDTDLVAARPPERWAGMASEAAGRAHERAAERMRRLTAGVAAAAPSVADAADAVAAIRKDLAAVDRLAADNQFAIGPDGAVTDHTTAVVPADQVEHVRVQRTVLRDDIVAGLASVLRRAEDVDRTLADLLMRAASGQIDDGAATTSLADAGAAGDRAGQQLPQPPPGAAPEANTAWWNSLDQADRDRLLAEHPERIGNLDGLPAAIRDEANRARVPGEIARVDAELAAADAHYRQLLDQPLPPGMEGQGETREQIEQRSLVDKLREQRGALTAVEAAVAGPDRQLLLLDVSGHANPRAAVAVGDVDTASHVAVFTPGFTSKVATSLKSYTEDMANVRDTSVAQLRRTPGREHESVATVAWLGYDMPQTDSIGEADRSVALPKAAQHGGAELAGFYQGIDSSRGGDDPHLTALGHSYGSTTTGYALQQTPTGIDDAVFFGSPGLSTGNVGDLHVPPGHVNNLEADWDGVADLGSFGGDPNHLPGVNQLSARQETAPDGTSLRASSGHSEYLAPYTTSQYNIAATVAGLPERTITGENSGFGDVVRSGALLPPPLGLPLAVRPLL